MARYDRYINNVGVSIAILLGGANSGRTSTKCCDLGCNVERPPLKNFKDLNETLELKHFFRLHLQTQIFIFISCMNEGSEMTKMLAHVNRMKKNPQTRAGIF